MFTSRRWIVLKRFRPLICFIAGFIVISIVSSIGFALGISLLLMGVKEM
jgi:hypothetical protein